MNFTGKSILFIFCFFISLSGFSQKKVKVIGIPMENGQPKVPSYMIKTSKGSDEGSYDSRVFGFPSFFPGHVIAGNGEKLEGFIALINSPGDTGMNWVQRCALLVLEDDLKTAYYIGPGDAYELHQKKRKEKNIYDLYDGFFLKRLVSGKANLYYNPYFKETGKVSKFLPASVINELRETVANHTLKNSLKNGKSFSQSLQTTTSLDNTVYQLSSSIKVWEKQYLLSANETTTLITEDNYEQIMRDLFKSCSFSEKEIKSYVRNIKKIKKALELFNSSCKQ